MFSPKQQEFSQDVSGNRRGRLRRWRRRLAEPGTRGTSQQLRTTLGGTNKSTSMRHPAVDLNPYQWIMRFVFFFKYEAMKHLLCSGSSTHSLDDTVLTACDAWSCTLTLTQYLVPWCSELKVVVFCSSAFRSAVIFCGEVQNAIQVRRQLSAPQSHL